MVTDPDAKNPIIPPEFDPTYSGEPTDGPPTEADSAEPDPGVLVLPEDRSAFEPVADPEDEVVELPAEEAAIHISRRPPRNPA